MRIFIDTEFWFDHGSCRVVPISLGLVAEDGREYYAVTTNWFPADDRTSFLRDHVLPVLDVPESGYRSVTAIERDLLAFVGDEDPEFWGDYAAFDYVVLSIVMGGFDAWPDGWPMHVNDLQQTAAGRAASAATASLRPHNALADARAVRAAYEAASSPLAAMVGQ